MTWLVSIILAGSLLASNNISIGDFESAEPQNIQIINNLDETEYFEQIYPINPNGRVSVSNINGSITIEAWDRNEVKLGVTKIADSRETLSDIEVKIDSSPDRMEIETDYGNWNREGNRNWDKNRRKIEVQYRLNVPHGAVLNEIETVNGSISLKNFTNYVKASAVNGEVNGQNLRGTAELSTVNGSVTGEFDQLQDGSIISLNTVNGSASLIIPSDANATVKAETVNGTITNEFGLPVRKGKYVGRDLYGKIGSGDVKVKLESVNGELSIKRKNDGKSTNPVINLLPPKSSDEDMDDDFDDDFESGLRDAHRLMERKIVIVRRAMENAMIVSGKDAIESIKANTEMKKAAAAEIAKIEPQIAKIDAEALREAAAAIELAEIKGTIESASVQATATLARMEAMRGLRTPFLEERSGSFQTKGIPLIRVESSNCPVLIRGWDKSEVKYSMSKVASNNYYIPIEFKADQKNDGLVELAVVNKNVQKNSKSASLEPTQVRLEIFVPKRSNLKIVTNDEIRLEGVSGEIDLKGLDAAINIRDADGKLNLRSGDGLVRVIGFRGDFESETADGDMFLEGEFESLHARLNDGTIVLTLPEKSNADVSANTDSVTGEGIDLIPRAVKSAGNHWRIGEGGRDFNFDLGEGAVIIRSLSDLKVS